MTCEIETLEQLDATLREMGGLDALEREMQADCSREVADVTEKYQGLMIVEIEGVQVAIDDRRSYLSEQVRMYCEANREQLLPKGKKSVELTNGKIGWKAGSLSLQPIEGKEEPTLLEKLLKPFKAKLQALFNLHLKIARLKLLDVVRFKIEWNKQGLLSLFRNRALTEKELAALGFQAKHGAESFYVEPRVIEAQAHSQRPAVASEGEGDSMPAPQADVSATGQPGASAGDGPPPDGSGGMVAGRPEQTATQQDGTAAGPPEGVGA